MTAPEQLLTHCRELMRMSDAARRSSERVIAESHALVKSAHAIHRNSRQLRERSTARSALRTKTRSK